MNKRFQLKRELPWVLFVLPALVIYCTVTVIPTLQTMGYSLTNFNGLSTNFKFLGLENYVRIFHNKDAVTAITNSLLYGFCVPALVTCLAIPLALILNSKIKSKNILRAVFFFPSVISTLFIGFIWKFILSPSTMGLINGMRAADGKEPLLLLADPKMAMVLLIFVTVWASTGWHACIYIANLQTISSDYYEAATIDGATSWQKFRNITFPMLAPAMTSSLLLLLTSSLKAFDMPFALTNGGPGRATTMITQMIIDEGVTANQVGYASAMSFLFLVIISIVSMLQTAYLNKRERQLYE